VLAHLSLVGWLAYGPGEAPAPISERIAVAPQIAAPASVVIEAKRQVPARIPLPSATNDYLLAHQSYSPRITLQGMAPYVRTVSDEAVGTPQR
jgi:hypothetical protein